MNIGERKALPNRNELSFLWSSISFGRQVEMMLADGRNQFWQMGTINFDNLVQMDKILD